MTQSSPQGEDFSRNPGEGRCLGLQSEVPKTVETSMTHGTREPAEVLSMSVAVAVADQDQVNDEHSGALPSPRW